MQAQPKEPVEPKPGVDVGDELYFQHAGEPRAGRVLAHGKHGCTLEHEGKPHKVKWEHVLGHKKRAAQHYAVVDQGEDGMIVEDSSGKRRFIGVANDAREDPMVAKAFGGDRAIRLFLKAKKTIRNKPDAAPSDANGDAVKTPQSGDVVSFQAGDFSGSGKIVGKPGRDGAFVKDASGRLHQVRWSEMHDQKQNVPQQDMPPESDGNSQRSDGSD